MRTRQVLFLLTDSYPFGIGELFLDAEVVILSRSFETIFVYSLSLDRISQRPLPENVVLLAPNQPSLRQKIKYGIGAIFFKELWVEFFSIKSRFKQEPTWLHFKILMADYMKAAHISNDLSYYCNKFTINTNTTIFYSYWHDSKALALCLLKLEKPIKSVARGHGWDIDYTRHKPAYLSFKKYIVSKLDMTFLISNDAKNTLMGILDSSLIEKVRICKLGVLNAASPILEVTAEKSYLICTCGILMKIKRINLVAEILKNLKDYNVKWVHFGDGYMRSEIEELCNIYKLTFEITGMIENSKIVEFYSNNFVDLFISLSETEGIPVSIMEAQSAGIPVLATNVGGCREIVNQENGFLISKEFDILETSNIIKEFFEMNRKVVLSYRLNSYENWKNNYNAETNYEEFSFILLSI